jgi:hypothetical protein
MHRESRILDDIPTIIRRDFKTPGVNAASSEVIDDRQSPTTIIFDSQSNPMVRVRVDELTEDFHATLFYFGL